MDAADMLRSLDEVARLWIESGGGMLPVSGRSMRPTFEDASRVWMEKAEWGAAAKGEADGGNAETRTDGMRSERRGADEEREERGKAECGQAGIAFGDVLVYRNGSFLVVHRVVGIHRGPSFRTKGDGLPHLDPNLVEASRVHGRVVEIEREGKRYRTDGIGGRRYARLVGCVSAVEGFLYRIAYRLDLALSRLSRMGRAGSTRAPVFLRRIVSVAGRAAVGALDQLLFKRLHEPA